MMIVAYPACPYPTDDARAAAPFFLTGNPLWGWWLSSLVGELIPGTVTRLRLTQPLVWEDANGRRIEVPAGFVSDGASKPQWTRSLIGGRFDKGDVRAAVVHDYGIRQRADTPSVVHKRFYYGMRADGVSWLTANVEYRAVQLFVKPWTPTRDL